MDTEKKEYHFVFRCACGAELRITDPTTEPYNIELKADGESALVLRCNSCRQPSMIYSRERGKIT